MSPSLLSEAEIAVAIEQLDGWVICRNGDQPGLSKSFQFSGFNAAFGFISRVALAAERANQHRNGRMSITRSPSNGPHMHKVV